ncbi:MAG: hypothetical protein ACM309_10340, partial [Bacillota bacterium]
ARRMKRIGARWTPEGADRMARLLAAKSNDELLRHLGRKASPAPESMTLPTVDIGRMSAQAEDVEAWLRAKVPALTGPFASREWIKHVLRAITSIQEVAQGQIRHEQGELTY